MLMYLYVQSLDELSDKAVPASIRISKPLHISPPVCKFLLLHQLLGSEFLCVAYENELCIKIIILVVWL